MRLFSYRIICSMEQVFQRISWFLRKQRKQIRFLFIDASREFKKVTNNNKLEEKNIDNIVEYYTKYEDKDYTCKVVSREKIAEEDYNLSVSTYVEQEDTSEKIDIKELNARIKEIVAREEVLRKEIDKIIEDIEGDLNE